ncbi:hypothetical protein [Frondihabitans peucedani]|uniref:Uncharacterized protein n=1 Tax=Frondihabitans peucedani TaxID=598626 RepID=A0ABP8E3X8_9MICO
MDNDQLGGQAGYAQPYGQALEARDYGLSVVGDAWLEEQVRQYGSD